MLLLSRASIVEHGSSAESWKGFQKPRSNTTSLRLRERSGYGFVIEHNSSSEALESNMLLGRSAPPKHANNLSLDSATAQHKHTGRKTEEVKKADKGLYLHKQRNIG